MRFLFLFLSSLAFSYTPDCQLSPYPHSIAVTGTGYVGLILGSGLAEFGHTVVCADIDREKIALLQKGIIPIFEPGLKEVVEKNRLAGRLVFTDRLEEAIASSELIFIAVGTPMGDNGQADLSVVESVAKLIGKNLNGYKVICVKSTVPIGSGKKISEWIGDSGPFDYVFNPEFLREGVALFDFFEPDRVVLGLASGKAQKLMREVYWPLENGEVPFLYTTVETAEAIKYASNAFLAVKVSFVNEFAGLCDRVGADVIDVALGMGLDHRIGPKFLSPGPGFGGSCFPKDTQALLHMSKEAGIELKIVQAAVDANERQKELVVKKLSQLVGPLQGKTIAVLGLAFKANTDDIRESPAIAIIQNLLKAGAIVRGYDPVAMKNMGKIIPEIAYAEDPYLAAEEADALLVLTEWEEFRSIDLSKVKSIMRSPNLVDTRNMIDPKKLSQLGFKQANIGRPNLCD